MKFVVFLALSAPLFAQYPGQYPPGQGPMGGGGVSMPSWHKKKKDGGDSSKQPTFNADGQTISNDGKTLVVGTADGRTITLALTPKTKYERSGSTTDIAGNLIVPRTTVHVEASEDDESNLTATTIQLVKDAPAEVPAEARTTQAAQSTQGAQQSNPDDMVRPTILNNSEEPADHPILKRGKPSHQQSDDAEDIQVAANRPASKPATQNTQSNSATQPASKDTTDFSITDDSDRPHTPKPGSDLIEKSREWSQTFTNGLPNFVCEQETTRYYEQSKSSGWQPVDIVTAKVVYEDGKENYEEITVGGKRVNKKMSEIGGSTSTGEFATTLRSLFSDSSQTDFKFYESTSIRGESAAIYDFKVALPNSDWNIRVGGQSLRPAYAGSVWIEKNTGQVRRIEMHAVKIPQDFPFDSVEWAVDYDSVSLGTSNFLLPVHAENLACQRGTTVCSKNAIDFRNYHKYSGESTVTFK